jgi:ABC-type branched-subunit amino acid transport system substrate-binding protein
MGKKAFSVLMLVTLIIALLPAAAAAAPAAAEGKVYTIQKDDWLSKLADKEYGDGSAYWSIYYYNNLMAVEDTDLAYIYDPDLIEVGDSLYLPSADEVETYLAGDAGSEPAVDVASVKIGEIHPFTGPLAEFGEPEQNSGLLAQKHLEGGGYIIEQVFGDTETSAIPAVENARQLVDVDGVQVLIGGAASGVTMPIAESVTIPSQVPQLSYASTSPAITYLPADEGQDFLFRTCPSDALQGPVLANMIYDEGLMKVSVMYVNNPYGQGLNDEFTKAYEALGGTVVASVPHDEEPAASYTAELRQATEGGPEALIAISYPGHATVYLKEALEGGFISEFRFVDGTKSEDIIEAVGADNVEGMCGTAPGALATWSLKMYEKAYEEEYGEIPPLPFMTNTYDAVIIASLAAYEAQLAGEELTGVAVRDHLRTVAGPPGWKVIGGADGIQLALELLRRGEDIDWIGSAGEVDFDEYGDVVTPVEVWCYEGGTIVTQ